MRIRVFFFFKQKTAYEMRISDWSSDVCSSDLHLYHLLAEVDLVVLHRLTLEGPEIAEVRRNQVPAPGNADVAGCRASIVQGVDTVVQDRKSVVYGKSVSVRVDLGGRRIIKKKNNTKSAVIAKVRHI